MQVPLFPLNTVLFPGGPLPLRIFEPRYIDMVSRCMKEELPFGVVLIAEGRETGPATTCSVGTLARISDFFQGSDGILGVTAMGERRFRLLSTDRQNDGLSIGRIELLDEEPSCPLPPDYQTLPDILEKVLGDLGRLYEPLQWRLDDAVWVSYRFMEILPIDLMQKQASLESSDTAERLKLVEELLDRVRN